MFAYSHRSIFKVKEKTNFFFDTIIPHFLYNFFNCLPKTEENITQKDLEKYDKFPQDIK